METLYLNAEKQRLTRIWAWWLSASSNCLWYEYATETRKDTQTFYWLCWVSHAHSWVRSPPNVSSKSLFHISILSPKFIAITIFYWLVIYSKILIQQSASYPVNLLPCNIHLPWLKCNLKQPATKHNSYKQLRLLLHSLSTTVNDELQWSNAVN